MYQDLKKIPPATITEFRETEESDIVLIPEAPENRKCTDVAFLVFFILTLLVMLSLIAYCSTDTDYYRFLNGYDKCGDTCGVKNTPIDGIYCSGKDMTGKPIMQLRYYGIQGKHSKIIKNKILADKCVEDCKPPNRLNFHRCFPKTNKTFDGHSRRIKTFTEFAHDLDQSIMCLIAMCLTGLVLSWGLVICFRFHACGTVFSVLILQFISLIGFTGFLWYWYLDDPDKTELLYIGIAASIFSFFISIFICYFHDRYLLVIRLFDEAMEAIFTMPLILLQPLATVITLLIMVTSMIFTAALVSTNENLNKSEEDLAAYEYVTSNPATACISYMVLVVIWIFAFANGCQCMIVSGSVAAYYFTRNKTVLSSAICKSFYVLMRYHLGTVAFGSLVITIVVCARIAVNFIRSKKFKVILKILECGLTWLEEFVDYMTKRAYIQTAMHGKPLYKSGVRGTRLLWINLMDTISLDVVGGFIMFNALLLIVLVATAVGIFINFNKNLRYFWSILAIGAAAAGTITYFSTQVLAVAIETIFLCFCEDKLLNNGKSRLYFMKSELMVIINKAKEAASKREEQ